MAQAPCGAKGAQEMFIWFFGIEVDERIEGFVRYADWGGPALLQLARRAEKRLEKECAPLEEEAADHRRLVHDAVYKGSIPRAFQHSCLLLLVAEIELLALRLCTTVRDRLGGGSLSKTIGEQPGQVRTYVAKSAGLSLSKHP